MSAGHRLVWAVQVLWAVVCCLGAIAMVSQLEASAAQNPAAVQAAPQDLAAPAPAQAPAACAQYRFAPESKGEAARRLARWTEAVKFLRAHDLTFLRQPALELHRRLIDSIEAEGVAGMVVEAGVAKGGSALALAAAMRDGRCLHLFDTFQGIPPPSANDGKDVHDRYAVIKAGKAGKGYYGYMPDLAGFVASHFVKVELGLTPPTMHAGLFGDTMWPAGPIAFAHIDGDWFQSVTDCLSRLVPCLAPGGSIVLDDV